MSTTPNPAERDESLLGQQIMHGFEYSGEGRWENGRVIALDLQ